MTNPTAQPGWTGRPNFVDIPPRVGERGFNIAFRRWHRDDGKFTVTSVDDHNVRVIYERGSQHGYRLDDTATMACLEHDTRFNIGDRIRWGHRGSDHTEVTITGIARNPPLDDKKAVGLTADRLRYVTDNPEFGEPFTVEFVDRNWSLADPRGITTTNPNPTEEPVTDTITATDVTVDQYRRERDEARQELERMRSDVAILNGLLNDAAADRDLCSEYERALDAFNDATGNRLGLTGRRRDRVVSFDVRVKFTGSDAEFDDVCAAFAEHLYMQCDGDYGDNDIHVEVSHRPDYTDLDD